MCGIVGYIGNGSTESNLVKDLKLLEYRGYDSAGIAVLSDGKIKVTKAVGFIKNLEEKIQPTSNATIGIAHTRWATHGEATIDNAHPHLSENGKWAIVHNGIIENYAEIKQELTKKGFGFQSETDTEIIPQMLEYCETNSIIETLSKVCVQLKGSFALAIINSSNPNSLFLAKRKSPLYLAKTEKEIFIASDPICFAGKTNKYFALNDDEYCDASLNAVKFFNKDGEEISKQSIELENLKTKIDKENFNHFMIKEIYETPEVFKRIVNTYSDTNAFNKIDNSILNSINKVIFVGCGTAYHAGLMGAQYIENFAKLESRSYIASEFRYGDPIIDNKTLAIFVSQSGETADTLEALELAKQKGAITVALTNVLYSTISKKANFVLPVCAGPEIAVASTKAYTAQISILNMFAKYLANLLRKTDYEFFKDILLLAENIKLDAQNLELIADEIAKESSAIFIGRGLDCITSEEASLKLKEITYINSQAYPAGELKHGFLALVEKGTPVFVVATQKSLIDKTLNAASEAASRGAKIILATQEDMETKDIKNLFKTIKLQDFKEDLMPMVAIYSFQMLSYLTSIKRGINPDKPRNLAKSVTVE